MKRRAMQYFQGLFECKEVNREGLKVPCNFPRWTQGEIHRLDNEFTASEVYHAIFEMAPLRRPSQTDFNEFFYQKLWNIIRQI